ncbi:MAG: hypothetical protein ACTSVA_00970 [Candidatus Njordarchaeales archaeon]
MKEDTVKGMSSLLKNIHLYNILSGIRGPDNNSPYLKWVLTGRLRAILGLKSEVPCREIPTLSFSMLENAVKDFKEWFKENSVGCFHYIKHLQLAFYSLETFKLMDVSEGKLMSSLCDYLENIANLKNYLEETTSLDMSPEEEAVKYYCEKIEDDIKEIAENPYTRDGEKIRELLNECFIEIIEKK